MNQQKEKAAPQEVTKCRVCGNENIKEKHNYCVKCGKQLKENAVVIDFRS